KLHEVNSYIWCDGKKFKKLGYDIEDNVKVLNIENSDNGVLRNSMMPTLLCIANENKDFSDKYGIFEIGRVVNGTKEDGTCNERKRLGVVLYDKSGNEKSLFYEALEMINVIISDIKHTKGEFSKAAPVHNWQHPKNTVNLSLNGIDFGTLCTLRPSNKSKFDKTAAVVAFEFDLNDFNSINSKPVIFKETSDMQSVYYDLSVILAANTKYADLEKCWICENISELESVKVIDTYEKLGVKSITVRLNFVSMDRTLEMDEVQKHIDTILGNLNRIGVVLKS
ncbi:MAG: hypothetical protein K6F64_07455, partial [Clostridia bacterium]|nr:hypothetical protein [Clostridia bacterium]